MFDNRLHIAEHDIASQLELSLKGAEFGYMDNIKFTNKIITDHVREKGKQRLHYKLFQ